MEVELDAELKLCLLGTRERHTGAGLHHSAEMVLCFISVDRHSI